MAQSAFIPITPALTTSCCKSFLNTDSRAPPPGLCPVQPQTHTCRRHHTQTTASSIAGEQRHREFLQGDAGAEGKLSRSRRDVEREARPGYRLRCGGGAYDEAHASVAAARRNADTERMVMLSDNPAERENIISMNDSARVFSPSVRVERVNHVHLERH